ncbi:MAG: alkane 1-monooxygenase [Chitinophagales bacterium]|nr:alkane 1-monooxygenase [Chitinophagales bacterium]
MLREAKYLAAYLAPLSALCAFLYGGIYSFLTPFIMFVLIPLLELLFTGTERNLTKEEESGEKNKLVYDLMIYLNVPIQIGLMIFFLYTVTAGGLQTYEIVGMTLSMGMCCGVLGINVAHELGHRHKKYEQVMAKILLSSSLYMHFFIEHNRGHHKNVSTDLDPASARLGESVYAFIFRSITGAYMSAWHLENDRIRKIGKPLFSLHNEMVRFHIYQGLLLLGVYLAFGALGLLAFIGAAAGGYFLLECTNYIEHYGLRRKELAPGHYEKTMPWHSWNSNHTIGRIMLYDLTRHSDHHYHAGRKYQILRHFDDSPQLPMGYPAAILMALIPPVWFAFMHKQLTKVKKGSVLSPDLAMA